VAALAAMKLSTQRRSANHEGAGSGVRHAGVEMIIIWRYPKPSGEAAFLASVIKVAAKLSAGNENAGKIP